MKHRPRRHKMFVVRLDEPMRKFLHETLNGQGSRRDKLRAQALIVADQSDEGPGFTDVAIARETGLSVRTIETVRKRFAQEGIASAVSWRRKKVDGATPPAPGHAAPIPPSSASDAAPEPPAPGTPS